MAYSTQADLEVLVPVMVLAQMTDDAQAGVVDPTKVAAAIEAADEVIDAFLRSRYTLPLSQVPRLLMTLSRDLAAYEVYSRRGEAGVPENIQKRADTARKMLLQIQRGELTLGIESPDVQVGGNVLVNKEESDRIFGPDTLAGF